MPINFLIWTFEVWFRFANKLAVAAINRALRFCQSSFELLQGNLKGQYISLKRQQGNLKGPAPPPEP